MAQYLRNSEGLIENLELKDFSNFSNMKIDQIVDVSEKLVEKYVDQGQELFKNNDKSGDLTKLAMDFWNSYSKSEQGKKVVGYFENNAKAIVGQGKELIDENGDKSLVELGKEIAESDQAKELVDEISSYFSWW